MKSAVYIGLILVCLAGGSAQAGPFAEDVSSAARPVIAVAGVLPALGGSGPGLAKAVRRYDAQLVAMTVTSLIKDTVHEWRPDRSDRKSFPSGHASAAFAMAGSLAQERPKQKWLYIGLAAVVAWSRVDLHKHHWHDVAAGAAIGYTSGRWSSSSDRGILIGRVFRW